MNADVTSDVHIGCRAKHEVFNDDLDMALAQNLKLAADLLAVTSERDELRTKHARLKAYIEKGHANRQPDIDQLLTEIERLKRTIADHEGWMTGTEETRLRSHNNELRSTVERLRAALQTIICDSHKANYVDKVAREALKQAY